jgi:hypothetical protein
LYFAWFGAPSASLCCGVTTFTLQRWVFKSGLQGNLCISENIYTKDYEVVPRPYKICDWLFNSSQDHFNLHQGKNVIVTMKFEVARRHFKAYIIHWHGPMDFVTREAKEVLW